LSIDGRTLKLPSNYVYELKYTNADIKGTAI
jgi:hypothetical protein